MSDDLWQIPPDWEKLDLSRLKGVLMVIGAPDSGKSVFVQYLEARLRSEGTFPAVIDGDPGQSRLGPPATLSLQLPSPKGDGGSLLHRFVGSVSPTGHMLEVLTGTSRLVEAARRAGAGTILHDTSGLIAPDRGGHALKRAKIDLLSPTALFALSRQRELEKLLIPLRRSRRIRVIDLPTSPAARSRERSERRSYRARRFAAYFAEARPLSLVWPRYGVIPEPYFSVDDLVGLEDREGLCRGLGLVAEVQPGERRLVLKTPLHDPRGIDILRIGDLQVDPETFEDRQIRKR